MLGRKTYTQEELDHARAAIDRQLAAYRRLANAVAASGDAAAQAALADLEPLLFNQLTLALDRYFVHRLRVSAGKDANPLNEVELLAASLLDGGALRTNNVIKWSPEQSVLGLAAGDRIDLTAEQFERLAAAFLRELHTRFVAA
jgi:hypothetical protein